MRAPGIGIGRGQRRRAPMGKRFIEREIRTSYGLYGIQIEGFSWMDSASQCIVLFRANGEHVSIPFSVAMVEECAELMAGARDHARVAIGRKVKEHPHYPREVE
jgi:hypothetical protein